MATATPTIADHTPIAAARSLGSVKTLTKIAKVAGKIKAAPMPMSARAPMSWFDVVERAASPDVPAKMIKPICNARRRPKRSPKCPMVSSSAEKTSV